MLDEVVMGEEAVAGEESKDENR